MRRVWIDDLLLWIVGHICKESREHTADDLISKTDQDTKLVRLYEIRGAEDQQPECLDEFTFAVGNHCLRGNYVKCIPIPIGKRVGELRHISMIEWSIGNISN